MTHLIERVYAPIYAVRLKRATRRCRTLEDYVDVALRCRYKTWTIAPTQIESEITALLRVLAQDPPKRVLEIGTFRGGTLYLFGQVAAPDAQLLSVDLPSRHSPVRSLLLRSLSSRQQRVHVLTGDSHHPSMKEKVQQRLGGRALDFLFIDGDHSYGGVKQDFELYAPLLRSGGLIAFHDIVPGPEKRVGGVPAFWQQIKASHRAQEFVDDWRQGGFGIGLIHVP